MRMGDDWSSWQAGVVMLGLLVVLLRLRRLSRRLAAVESAAWLAPRSARQQVSVAELLARKDAPGWPRPLAGARPSKPAGTPREVEITMPVPRPRQLIRLGPPPKATEDDPGPWFRPTSPRTADRAAHNGSRGEANGGPGGAGAD